MKHIALRFALAAGLLTGAASAGYAAESATSRLPPKPVEFSFEGPFGTYDRAALQRGFQVYKDVCAICHSLKRVAYRNLADHGGPGFTQAQAQALAAAVQVPAEVNDQGQLYDDKGTRLTRAGILADYFPQPFPNEEAARAANAGAFPPDLSLLAKSKHDGPHYLYSLLTGYNLTPPKGFTVADGKYYNPYYEGWTIGMPPPLAENSVTYSDGTKATVEQQTHDLVTFLTWAAEPKMEERKRMGFSVLIFLVTLAGILFAAYRKVWKDQH